jgi:hypothetical protein
MKCLEELSKMLNQWGDLGLGKSITPYTKVFEYSEVNKI